MNNDFDLDTILNQIGRPNFNPPTFEKESKEDKLSKVTLSENLISDIIGFTTGSKVEEKAPTVVKKPALPTPDLFESKLQTLVNQLTLLLKEAKGVIEEMTTTGMIGTNQKFSLVKKPNKAKNGLVKNIKRN